MRIILAALFVILALAVIPAAAQPLPPDGCERAGYVNLFNEAAILLDEDTSSDDPDILADMLTFIIHTIQSRRAECAGLAFSGDTNAVVGPFDLPAGDYIAESTADYVSTITFETLTDGCEQFVQYEILSILDTEGGADSLILRTDADCSLLAEVSSRRPWTLTFTPIG